MGKHLDTNADIVIGFVTLCGVGGLAVACIVIALVELAG